MEYRFVRYWFTWVFVNFVAGVTHVGGDMFQSIPAGDAIFMKVRLSLFATYNII